MRSSDGTELAVHELGGSGPLLLLAHATGYCSTAWRPVADELSDEFRCVAFDGRAHGASASPSPDGFSWPILGDDVLAVLADTDGDGDGDGDEGKIFAAGHSAGAAGIVLAASGHPELFAGIWCFEPVLFPPAAAEGSGGPPGDGPSNPMAAAARRRRDQFSSPEEALGHFAPRKPFSGFHPDALAGFVDGGLQPDPGGGFRLACRPDDEARFYEMGGFEATWDAPADLQVPAVFATGDQPGSFGAGHAERLAERSPSSRAEVIGGVSHFGPLERPDLVARSIRGAFSEALTTRL